MSFRLASILRVLVAAAAIAAATAGNAATGGKTEAAHELNLGYGLLHEILSDLSDADKLLYVKVETKPVEELVERLASTTKRINSRLESFAKAD
jgi:hypothetical protein